MIEELHGHGSRPRSAAQQAASGCTRTPFMACVHMIKAGDLTHANTRIRPAAANASHRHRCYPTEARGGLPLTDGCRGRHWCGGCRRRLRRRRGAGRQGRLQLGRQAAGQAVSRRALRSWGRWWWCRHGSKRGGLVGAVHERLIAGACGQAARHVALRAVGAGGRVADVVAGRRIAAHQVRAGHAVHHALGHCTRGRGAGQGRGSRAGQGEVGQSRSSRRNISAL